MLRRILRLRGAKVAYIDKGREEKKALVALENKKLVQLKTTVERYREVFLALGFDLPPIAVPPRVRYSLDAETEALAGAHEGKKWIGIAPFAQHQGKIYPLEQMERVIAMLSQMPGVRLFVFGGGAAEREYGERMEEKYGSVVSVIGRIKLAREMELISHLDLMLSMDSSAMHMASLCRSCRCGGRRIPMPVFTGSGRIRKMPYSSIWPAAPVRFTATGLAPMATIPVCGALLPNRSSGRCARLRDSLRSPYPNPDAVSTPI